MYVLLLQLIIQKIYFYKVLTALAILIPAARRYVAHRPRDFNV